MSNETQIVQVPKELVEVINTVFRYHLKQFDGFFVRGDLKIYSVSIIFQMTELSDLEAMIKETRKMLRENKMRLYLCAIQPYSHKYFKVVLKIRQGRIGRRRKKKGK